MAEAFIRQAILHGVMAAGIVEALLTTWRIRSASARLKFWLIALAVPFLLLPLFLLAAPYRLDDHFAAGAALFASVRWNPVRLAGMAVDRLVFGLLALVGIALLLRDLLPLLLRGWRDRNTDRPTVESASAGNRDAQAEVDALTTLVRQHAERLGVPLPPLEVLPQDHPVLFVRGIRHHTLVVSTGAFAQLSAEQASAAVAHELAHVRLRDPLLGWLLMAARLVMFWNPAVQLVARAIAQETEHRADAAAVRATSREAYRAAFRLLASHGEPTATSAGAWGRLAARMHRHHVEARSAAMTPFPDEPPFLPARLLAVSGVLAGLLFFVV